MANNLLTGERMIDAAAEIAKKAHEGALYGSEPYFWHAFEVAALAKSMGYGAVIQATGYLHDTVEDTGMTLEDISVAGFPSTVVASVEGVTFIDEEDNPSELRGDARGRIKMQKAKSNPVSHVTKYIDASRNFATTVSQAWRLGGPLVVAEYAEDYVGYLTELQPGLPTPQDITDYSREVDGESVDINPKDGYASSVRMESNVQQDVRMLRFRLREARKHSRDLSAIEASILGNG